MKISKNQFEILVYVEKNNDKKITQRELAKKTNLSLGLINKSISELLEKKYILVDDKKNMTITNDGLKSLEPFKVKRAIFLGAGFGSRLIPITLNTPKPLVRVHGKPMIETLLDACINIGITEMYIVTGHLSEQFEILKHKYPSITLIKNYIYNQCNNISSMIKVKHLLENAYVFECDLVLSNPEIIRKYEYSSNYLGVYVEKTDDWRYIMKNGYIRGMKLGGEKCYRIFGISYWTQQDGAKLEKYIEDVFNQLGGKERFWDEVAFDVYNKEFNIELRVCKENDILEIDNFYELQNIDSSYKY